MRGYAECHVFASVERDLWRRATELVARVNDEAFPDLRCHELVDPAARTHPGPRRVPERARRLLGRQLAGRTPRRRPAYGAAPRGVGVSARRPAPRRRRVRRRRAGAALWSRALKPVDADPRAAGIRIALSVHGLHQREAGKRKHENDSEDRPSPHFWVHGMRRRSRTDARTHGQSVRLLHA